MSEKKLKEQKSVEENFNEIEEIIVEMQKEDVTLDTAFDLYNKGLKLIKDCNGQLDSIEKQIKILEEENINE
ncbi:exodeoxyribonuclease VII small subunit [uncultured Eubacterium sp.]|uniref:exodeoxyribonuclease VII small subunit n=1 Tax=uncultured Eubacterium sp. TaxID=165185 RepID=UPI002673F414|nr:exodeoxyribonuclease VII small subunit [uncultured Eubacterium sp.]